MSSFRAINARPVIDRECFNTSVDGFRADDEAKADTETSGNNAEAIASPDRGVIDIDSTGIDPADSGGDQSISGTPDSPLVTEEIAHTTTANAAAGNHDSNATVGPIDSLCEAVARCRAGSGDHRKTVSHIFGRNKAATRGIPEDSWIKWCRKHYQRFTYRDSLAGNWHKHQLRLVREQIDRFENRTTISSWKIALRKKEQGKLDMENAAIAAGQITLITPSLAPNNLSNSTSISSTAVSGIIPPPFTAVASGAADSTILATKSTSTLTGTAPSSADAAIYSPTTANHEINDSATSDVPTTVSPNTFNTISIEPDIATIDHAETLSSTLSDADDDEDTDAHSTAAPPASQLWERFLVPYLGAGKTFADIRTVCDAIELEFITPAFQARDNEKKIFPGVEFLPVFPDPKARMGKTKVAISTAEGAKRKAGDMKAATSAMPTKRPRLTRGAKA